MFARIEVAVRPDFLDSAAQGLLRRIELAHPQLRRQIRWARLLDVYWLDLPVSREELIPAITEICWDRVLQWVFTGNLMPSAAGKTGGLQDLLELSHHRPGKFWGIERRFRSGVTDSAGKSLLEAIEIVLGKKLPQARTSTGGLFVMEGPELDEDGLSVIARDVLCNEMVETWTLVPEDNLKKNDRFHQERVKYDIPKWQTKAISPVETIRLTSLTDSELEALSQKRLLALSLVEMKAVRDHFAQKQADPTDVELEVIAQTWSEHCKHKIFNAKINYQAGAETEVIDGLFKTMIAGTTDQIPKPWLLSVFKDNAGICIFDDEDAFCVKVETHNSPSALEPLGGALTGILGVNRDILGCGLGAKPIFNTDVFCVAPPDYSQTLPDRILHPRRILDGIRRGVEQGGNKSGIPTVNGALVFDDRYLGKPLVYCGSGGMMPRMSAGQSCEVKKVLSGDRICMVGGRIGKDGIHGATFSSLAMNDQSPASAVQLGDPMTQKRTTDFILEARELGLYRAITDNGAGGLSSSVGEMAELSGGARLDVSLAKTKYPGLKPYELVVSESQERMTLAVPPTQLEKFMALADRRSVEVSDLGEFNSNGKFEITMGDTQVASLDLEFLHRGVPRLELNGTWESPPDTSSATDPEKSLESFRKHGSQALLGLLSRPNIASKEWLIRQYDHEVQGTSVIKPLHTAGGPNDGGVIKPKSNSDLGLAVGCGINPKLSDIDPYLMAQSAVDESIRNVLCVGAEYGTQDSVLALVDNFCWPDPVGDPVKTGWLVRACQGLREAALELSAPLISGKDSMKNDFRGRKNGEMVSISVPPTLLMTAVARVADVKLARTSDFKVAGDIIYLLGHSSFGCGGSELSVMMGTEAVQQLGVCTRVGLPAWSTARKVYGWMGGASGKQQFRLKSLHDISEGGLLVAVTECLLARSFGAKISVPSDRDPWEFGMGEGFHSFIGSASAEDAAPLEAEWDELGIPFKRIGTVEPHDRLEVYAKGNDSGVTKSPQGNMAFTATVKQLRSAWVKEGYWE